MKLKKRILSLALLGLMAQMFVNGFAQAKSDWDANAYISAREFGFIPKLDVGYNVPLWGNTPKADDKTVKDVMYGYIRPSVRFHSVGLINGAHAYVDIFPISALQIGFGKKYSHVTSAMEDYDDTQINNKGMFKSTIMRARLIFPLGLKGLNGFVKYTSEKMDEQPEADKLMLHYSYNLYGKAGGDTLDSLVGGAFYSLNDTYKIGVVVDSTKMKESGSKSKSMYLFGQMQSKSWKEVSYMAGAGTFSADNGVQDSVSKVYKKELSNDKRRDGFSFIWGVTYTLKQGMGLR